MAMSPEDCTRAYVGEDDSLWKPMPSYIAPGALLYRGGRGPSQGTAQPGRRQGIAGEKRLCRPAGHRSKGELELNGWSSSPAVEAEVEAWYAAKSLDEVKEIARRLNKAAFDHVPYAPLGRFWMQMAWRKSLAGMAPAPMPFPWG